ncbi:malto-oligosyltrehalose synthase [Microcoleus sp. FACHB-1515]|uniref:malto-oligosyltrehalose synthase n=1 Tax=Cyanophyceae TaxID=3028117 RepID=UPI001688BA0C|nr:malto-oligosyltrehalose synthase [Microcoleus sp. FACHB-1515]MBD2091627.1 malto-oligosyltrehalose synthase [Microcoleus sp. FACHB-1515]
MKIPTATYRLQFHSGFPFGAAQEIIDYIADLGISDVYASPIFKARSGSTHGYDVVDPNQLNPELGTSEDFTALMEAVQGRSLGWLQDIVPNHMAYDNDNLMLMDVLENGSNSEYFDYFDINWNHPYEDIHGRILAPLLGSFYGESLENGEIKLEYDESGLSVTYYALKLPVRIESYTRFLTHNLGSLARSIGRRHPDFIKLLGILYLLKSAPNEAKGKERYDQITFVKGLLRELYEQNPDVKAFIDDNVRFFSSAKDNPDSIEPLHQLLTEQFYRLSFWKVGAEEINYRRFFTVNELISVRVEELKVFNKTHSLIEQLVKEGRFTGLRIDHIDGLYDPATYLDRLREKVGDIYITVEKILEIGEQLPPNWPVEGTSGYDFLNYVNGVFCLPENADVFQAIYYDFAKLEDSYEELVAQKKYLIIDKNLAGDVENLAQRLKRIAGQTRRGSDFTLYGLKRALSEVLALFPVYRTYITEEGKVTESDRHYIEEAIAQAKSNIPLLTKELEFIQNILEGKDQELLITEHRDERVEFVMRMQQVTGPLMAKGVEDTLLYVYNRLISLNEVGGNPGHFGITVDQFHTYNQDRLQRWPEAMSATATHDTKRGEDVRSRLNVLSELPEEWREKINTWSEMNQSKKVKGKKGATIPDRNDEYFFYQTLIGSFPFADSEIPEFEQRIKDYLTKAIREAKVHTAWLRPDSEYEEGCVAFINAVLADREFLEAFKPFQRKIAEYGVFNSLSQVLLKNVSPGVPDLYQGAELWDLSMVDPDNRRPVDYEQRMQMLEIIKSADDSIALAQQLLAEKETATVKLFLTYKLLQARKIHTDLFLHGSYEPLTIAGQHSSNVIAFARHYEGKTAIAIAPRFFTQLVQPGGLPLGEVWGDTVLKLPSKMPTQWQDAVTHQAVNEGEVLSLSSVLAAFPVALLISNA